jgi:hypothetical protein
MSMFSDDFATANDLFAETFGEQVTLVRGATESAETVTAQVTAQTYSRGSDDRIITTFESTDFVIDIDDYDFGSGAVSPRSNDRIKRTINEIVNTYEVKPIPSGRCFEPNVDRYEYIIHTKHVSPK